VHFTSILQVDEYPQGLERHATPAFVCAPDRTCNEQHLRTAPYGSKTSNEQRHLHCTVRRCAASRSHGALLGFQASRHLEHLQPGTRKDVCPCVLLIAAIADPTPTPRYEAFCRSRSSPESAKRALYSRVLAPKRTVAPTASCRATFGRIQTPSMLVRCAARTEGERSVACRRLWTPCTLRCRNITLKIIND